MKRMYVVLVAATALVGTGCAQRTMRESSGDVAMGSAANASAGWGANLRGGEGYRDTRGTAYARPTETGTQVALTIEGGFAGSRFAWDMREGTCATPGQAIGDPNLYPYLMLGDRGMGSAIADLSIRMEQGRQYIVNLYSTAAESRTQIACAALTR